MKTTTEKNMNVYCSTTYAGKILGVSVGTIQNLVEAKKLTAWKTEGGHRRILVSSIIRYKASNGISINSIKNQGRKINVLVVEDDVVTRDMIVEICNKADEPIDCTAMSSAVEALLDISSINPDILITDLNLPGINGFELLKKLRLNALFDRMIIIVISGLSEEEIAKKGGLPDSTIFVEKPLNAMWLNGFFSAVSTLHKMQDELDAL